MKKISLLKKLSIGTAAIAAITPITFTLSSCSKKNAIITRYASFEDIKDGLNDEKLDCLKTGYFSANDLLLGTKKFNKGNYILFIGTNTVNGTVSFFGGEGCTQRNADQWFENNDYVTVSTWYKDIFSLNGYSEVLNKIDRNFALVSFIDNFDYNFYDKKDHQIYVTEHADEGLIGVLQNVTPFKKWTKEIITQTKILNKREFKYDWDDESVEADKDYIRQDAQAKAYRALAEKGAAMFPVIEKARDKTFDVSENCNPQMAIYKDGRLMEIADIPAKPIDEPKEDAKDTTTLFGTINKYFTEEEDEPEEK